MTRKRNREIIQRKRVKREEKRIKRGRRLERKKVR